MPALRTDDTTPLRVPLAWPVTAVLAIAGAGMMRPYARPVLPGWSSHREAPPSVR